MGLNVKIEKDTLSPKLRTILKNAPETSGAVVKSMAVALHSWTVQSFTDTSRRISAWSSKSDGKPSTLQKTTKLRNSIRPKIYSPNLAKIETDAVYASAHQFGSERKALPARPFFPFTPQGEISKPAEKSIYAAAKVAFNNSLK